MLSSYYRGGMVVVIVVVVVAVEFGVVVVLWIVIIPHCFARRYTLTDFGSVCSRITVSNINACVRLRKNLRWHSSQNCVADEVTRKCEFSTASTATIADCVEIVMRKAFVLFERYSNLQEHTQMISRLVVTLQQLDVFDKVWSLSQSNSSVALMVI
jgi:hypothetical protein